MEQLQLQDLPVLNSARDLQRYGVVRVAQVVYQAMYDMAYAKGYSNQSKYMVMQLLEEWLREKYPDHHMVASVELSAKEALDLQPKFPGIEFGIYVRLIRRDPGNQKYHTHPTDILDMIVYRDSWYSKQDQNSLGAMWEPDITNTCGDVRENREPL